MFNWLKTRLTEKSSWNGIIVGAVALISLLGGYGLIETALWAAIVWAVYNFWWKEKE
tara:strand:- start:131 stop:301 length:171 start_codon:yes stop_codon:yes gene_type:complete